MAKKKAGKSKEYLWLECEDHEKRPWYVCCVHVMKGSPPAVLKKPVAGKSTGTAVCAECSQKPPDIDMLRGCCDRCVESKLLPVSLN